MTSRRPPPATGATRPPRRRTRAGAARQRRHRLLLVAAVIFGVAVLATSFPVSALVRQHDQVSQTAAALRRTQEDDAALSAQAQALSNPATVNALARQDFDLVPAGQKAYVVLPPSGSSNSAATSTGHVPLEGAPVAPGSPESQAILGAGDVGASSSSTSDTPASAAASPDSTSSPSSASSTSGRAPGLWRRVVNSLEFWR